MVIQHSRRSKHTVEGVMRRCAFSMIELIFAIVIIGISMLALPMIMFTDASSQEDSLMQEAIMLSTTKIAQVLTFPWDQTSPPETVAGLVSTSQVVNTAGNAALARNGVTDFRIGHFPEQLRRRLTPFSAQRAAGGVGAATDISSFNGNSVTINATGGNEQFSYKKDWLITTTVSYIADTANYAATGVSFDFSNVATGGTSNIKMVQVTVTDQTAVTLGVNANQVILTSYSANIGESEFYKRRY